MNEQEQQILLLKGRVFDLTESLASLRTQGQQFADVLSKIAQLLSLEADENGSVRLEAIVSAVEALAPEAPVQEELPLE